LRLVFLKAPNGWRVSGEPGRAQRVPRVRCTRVLGRRLLTNAPPEQPLEILQNISPCQGKFLA